MDIQIELEAKKQPFVDVVIPENLYDDPDRALKPCVICGGVEVRRIYRQAHFPVVCCRSCRLLYADEHFTLKDLARFYSGDYYQSAYVCHPPQIDEKIAEDYLETFRRVHKMMGGGRILDFGSARGTFLAHLLRSELGKHWSAEGIDINRDEVEMGRRAGNPVRVANVMGPDLLRESYDVITAFSVIEHLQQPDEVVVRLHELLKPRGKVLIHVPNGDSLIIQLGALAHWLSGEQLRSFSDNVFHEEHLYYFSPKTMPLFLKKCGLKLVWLGFQPSYLEAHAPPGLVRIFGSLLGLSSWVFRRQTMLVAIAERA